MSTNFVVATGAVAGYSTEMAIKGLRRHEIVDMNICSAIVLTEMFNMTYIEVALATEVMTEVVIRRTLNEVFHD